MTDDTVKDKNEDTVFRYTLFRHPSSFATVSAKAMFTVLTEGFTVTLPERHKCPVCKAEHEVKK